MSLTATGVEVRIRSTEESYAMHDVCADNLLDLLIADTGLNTLSADFPAVIVGPIFASSVEWVCAHSECLA